VASKKETGTQTKRGKGKTVFVKEGEHKTLEEGRKEGSTTMAAPWLGVSTTLTGGAVEAGT